MATTDKRVKVSAEGLNELVDKSKSFKDNMQAGARAALEAAKTTTKSYSSDKQDDRGVYNQARASIGTGAEARDFAKQSQGLGGLVHLYATLAANIFAAGAAFNALKGAADTTNLIKGLDQVGAASGRNLGTLAKDLAKVSDGAVSLREAMTATALASSTGFSNKQILEMGDAAKKASQSLGIAMPDALSRITRGISKLEPELLDELGIMVRLDKAVSDYAAKVGKSVLSLTDFERRQAFANAVLTQAKDKFGEVTLAANPYSKLLASLADTAQSSLEFVNKFLGPVVKLLSESPTALALALGYVGKTLLSMAIPAMAQWGEQLKKNAKIARASADEIVAAYGDNYQAKLEARFQLPELAAKAAENRAKFEKIMSTPSPGRVDSLTSIKALGNVATLSEQEYAKAMKATDRLIADRKKKVSEEESKIEGVDTNAVKARQAEIAALEIKKKAAKDYREANLKSIAAENAAQEEADKKLSLLDEARYKKAQTARAKESRLDLLSTVGDTAKKSGIFDALVKLDEGIKEKGIKGFEAFRTKATGALIAIASTADILATALSSVFMWIGIIGAAFAVFDTTFNKANKELDDFNDSVKRSDESLTNIDRTLARVGTSKGLDISGTQAVATAYFELSSALDESVIKYNEFLNKASAYDKFKQGARFILGTATGGLIDKDAGSRLTQELSTSIAKAFSQAGNSPEAAQFKERLIALVGPDTSAKGIEAAVGGSVDKAKLLLDEFKKFTQEASVSAARLTEFKTGLDQTVKLSQDLSNSFLPSDAVGKLGVSMLDTSKKMLQSLDKPLEQLKELNEIIKDTAKLALFGPETARSLMEESKGISTLSGQIEGIAGNIANYKQQLANIDPQKLAQNFGNTRELERGLKDAIRTLETEEANLQKAAANYSKAFSDAQIAAASKGADLVGASIKFGFEKAALTVERALVTGWSGLGAAAADLKVTQAEISLQQRQINAQIENTKTLKELTLELESTRLAESLKAAKPSEVESIQKKIDVVNIQKSLLKANADYNAVAKMLKDSSLNKETRQAAAEFSGFATSVASAQAQSAQLAAQSEAAAIAAKVKGIQEKLNDYVTGEYKTKKDSLDLDREKLQIMAQLTSGLTYDYEIRLANNKLAQMDLDDKKAVKEFDARIAELSIKKYTSEEIAATKAREANRKTAYEGQKAVVESQKGNLEVNNLYLQRTKIADDMAKADARGFQTRSATLDLETARLDANKNLNYVTEATYNRQKDSLDRQKLELETEKAKADILTNSSKEYANLAKSKAQAEAVKGDTSAIVAEMDRLLANTQKDIDLTNASAIVKTMILDITSKTNAEQERLNRLLEDQQYLLGVASSFADSLGIAFGKVGEAVGNLGKQLAENAVKEQKYAEDKIRLNEQLKNAKPDSAEELDALKRIDRADKQKAKDDLTGMANLAGATKKMFAEKTAAYKVLNTLEKALHIQKLAMDVKEMISNQTGIVARITGAWTAAENEILLSQATASAQITASTPAIMAKFFETMGPWGWAAGAAAIAAIGGVFSGGGSMADTTGRTAEDAQKVQGTGQRYVNGKLVDTGGGVFGDATAKSNSIKNSIDILNATTVEGVYYSSAMVDLLTSIDKGINNASGGLYSLIRLNVGNVNTGTTGGGGGILGGLFGSSSSSKEVIDAGIKWTGNFLDVINNADEAIQGFTRILTTSKSTGALFGLFGGSTSSSIQDETFKIGDKVTKQISQVFSSGANTILEAGKQLGITGDYINSMLAAVALPDFSSLKDLKGQELQTEFNHIISSIFDDASAAVFPMLEKYKQVGEGMLETVIRVLDGSKKVDLALSSVGMSFTKISTIADLDASESLIKLAGGLDAFISKTKQFADKFVPEAVRFGALQSTVSSGMKDIADSSGIVGIASIANRDEFYRLVTSLDLSTEAGRKTYTALMNIAPAFDEVATGIDKFKDSTKSMMEEVYTLLDTTESNALLKESKRNTTLAGTDPKLQQLQRYIFALEDEKDAKAKLSAAYKTSIGLLKSTSTDLRGFITTFTDFKKSLLLSSDYSPLTPAEKYATAKANYDAVLAAAKDGSDPIAQKLALSKLQSSSTDFLEASKLYNASSPKYTEDFNSVTQSLDSMNTLLSKQASIADIQLQLYTDQLAGLDPTTKAVETVNESILLVQTAMQSLAEQQGKTATALLGWKLEQTSNIMSNVGGSVTNPSTAPTTTASNVTPLPSSVSQDTNAPERLKAKNYMEYVRTQLDPYLRDASTVEAATKGKYYTPIAKSYDKADLEEGNPYGSSGALYNAYVVGRIFSKAEEYYTSIPQYAKGGYASGMSIVGERGAELVDFKTPGRVYTAEQTFGMFNGNNQSQEALVEEIKKLRNEVAMLREQQQRETGDLINAAYDAQAANANSISDSITTSIAKQTWTTKVKQSVSLI